MFRRVGLQLQRSTTSATRLNVIRTATSGTRNITMTSLRNRTTVANQRLSTMNNWLAQPRNQVGVYSIFFILFFSLHSFSFFS